MDIILFYNFNSLIWLTGIVEVVSTCSRQPKLITCSKNDNNNYNVPFLHVFNWKSNKQKLFLPHPLVKLSIVGSLRDREVAYLASDLQGLNFESCVWRAVSSHLSHHPQEVLLAQFSLYVHKSGLKPESFHFISLPETHLW